MEQAINKQVQTANAGNQVTGNELSLKDIWYLAIGHWYWFIISIFVCMSLAAYYLLKTPKSYTREASILIKEDKNGKSIGTDVSQAFQDMGLGVSRTNVYNELITLQSNDVAKSVAQRLNFNVKYSVDGTFHAVKLYGTSLPVKVEFPGANDDDQISFDLDVNAQGHFKLTNLSRNGQKYDDVIEGQVGYKMVNTKAGKLVILKTRNFTANNLTKTIHVNRISIDAAKSALIAGFKADLDNKNATVVKMSYIDVSPQCAEDVLNTYISVYNENWMKDKNQIAVSTSEFINERLTVIQRELGDVDSNISSYKTANRITDLQASGQMYLQQSTQADAQIMNLNNQIYMAKYIRSYISNPSNNFQLLPANTGIQDGSVTTQINQYNNTLLQRNNIVANSSESNPIVVDLDKQLAAIRSALSHSIDNTVLTLETQLNSQRSYAGIANSKISNSPTQARHLLSEERQQKVKESLYLFLLQKREENELSQAFTAYNTRVVSAPYGSKAPTAPVSSKIILIAFVIGFCIPLAYIYLRETMNTKVRCHADIKDKVAIPYLGEVPTYINNIMPKKYEFWRKKKAATTHKDIVVKESSRGMLNEAFRIIATNLEFMSADATHKGNVFMTTSYNQGSGKSFVTANIGSILAIKKNRVLLIDGDLRHASVSNIVNKPAKGIADYLSGHVDDVHSVIVKSQQFESLSILPVGTIPPNPAELLASPRFSEMLEILKKEYDYVLIDCPPADMIADATIVGRYADRCLFVVRAGLFERSMLSQLDDDYNNGKFKNIAIILNATYNMGGHYGYKYGYKYGYRYGYKYGYKYGYGDKTEED